MASDGERALVRTQGVPTGRRQPGLERVLFIGTQFSILYTSMYSPAEAATLVVDVCGSV